MTSIMYTKLGNLRKLEVIYYTVAVKMKMNNEIKSLCKADKNGKRKSLFIFLTPTFRGFYCNLGFLIASRERKEMERKFSFQNFSLFNEFVSREKVFYFYAYDVEEC